MGLDAVIAEQAREQYARERDRYVKLAKHVAATCMDLVNGAGIQATIQHRAKSPDSLYNKLIRYIQEEDRVKIEQASSAAEALDMLGDLAGVRVATYVEADRGRVVGLIRERFRGPSTDSAVVVDSTEKETGYRATHCQVLLPADLLAIPETDNIRTTSAEIQVCSMLAHVWNEIEHDMRYKLDVAWGEDRPLRDQTLERFHDATEVGDACIEDLLGLRSEKTAASLRDQVAVELSEVQEFSANATAVLREVVRLGYGTFERIRVAFLDADCVRQARDYIGKVNVAFAVGGVPDELMLNPNNADVLLALLLMRHWSDLTALYAGQLARGDALRAARIAQAVKDNDPYA